MTLTKIQITGLVQYHTGLTFSEWAKQKGWHKSLAYRAIESGTGGTDKAQAVRDAVAKAIKKPLDEIWPEEAGEKG